MNCPNCQTVNPEGARFCMSCGTSLSISCPNCGTSLPPGAKFCFNCGFNLAAQPASPATKPEPALSPAEQPGAAGSRLQQFIPKELLTKLESARASGALEGERRIVTMLFCDVKGSTAAASQLDPEEWAEIINKAFEHMIRPIYQYEGTVARLMGDGLLAFFGAPIAHEDDPQRAVLAGLQIDKEIQEYRQEVARQWGIDLDVRVGINTGLVVVGAVGSDLRMEYTALGDAINMAARMEQTAQPGTVQVAEATYKLIAPLFDFEVLESVEVKGKSEPVRAYRVLGQKLQPGRLRGIAGLEAPLIGRAQEMESLRAAVGELMRGRGQIVSVLGEAGLGKSRLVAELRHWAASDAGIRLQWLEGRSHSYETSTPYAPFIDIFTECLDLLPGLNEEEKYLQLKARIVSMFSQHGEDMAPFIATLLEIHPSGEDSEKVKYLEPPILRSLIYAHAGAFFERLATNQPLVLVFEDLHWIDPTSLDLLESLLPLTDRAPVMFLAALRPRRQDASWRFHETAGRDYVHRYSDIFLAPLKEAESRELLSSLLHVEDLPEKVRRLIMERAEGNPFFVEEMIRTLLETGLVVRRDGHWIATGEIENISIPDTLAGVITARLDLLDENSKQVAHAAAIIGRDFTYEVLADLVASKDALESGLSDLQRRELIREKSRLPERTYLFKHILTQEAAYHSILLSRRRELHQQVARSLQQRSPDKPADIARHFLEARQPAQAVPYLVEAGDRAAHAYSSAEAIEFYSKALGLQDSIEDRQLVRRIYEGLGSALTFANQIPQALENYQAMLRLAENRDDISMQVSALNKLASVSALRMGRFQEADQYLARSDRLAHEQDVKTGIVEMSIIRCQMCSARADFTKLVTYMDEVVQIGRETGVKEYQSTGLEHVSGGLMFLTRFDEALKRAREGLKVAREIGDREHEAWLLTQTIPACLAIRGELDEAAQLAHEGAQLAARIGSLGPQIYGNWLLAEIARWRGEYEKALGYGQRSLDVSLPLEPFMPFMTVQPLGCLGSIYLEISRHFSDQIAKFHLHALKILESPFGVMGGGTAWADVGFCAMALGDLEMAEACFQKGLNHPTMFMLVERPRYLVGSALLSLARGQLDQAARQVEEGRTYAEERRMVYIEPLIALTAGRIYAAQGKQNAALDEFDRAETLALDMQMRPIVWQARAAAAIVLDASGRAEEAEAERQAAKAMIEEIAGLFQDEELREGFRSSAMAYLSKQV